MPRNVRQAGRWLCLAMLVLYGTTTGGSMATDIMSYEVTKGIVESGTVAMSRNIFNMDAHRGIDGRYYAPYGVGHAIYSVPFYAAARAVEQAAGVRLAKDEALRKAGFVAGSAVAAALTVWVTFLFAWRLTSDAKAALWTAAALGLGTVLWPYSKFGFSAPLGVLCTTFGTYGVWAGVRLQRPALVLLGGMGLGSAMLVRHELILLCIPVGLWIIVESKFDWRRWLRTGTIAAAPVVAAILITLYYNYVRFGNPLDTGYLRDVGIERGSIFVGLIGFLVSPGGSLFVYSPILLAGCAALVASMRDRSTAALFAGEVLILTLLYASFTHWDADRSYGPRYLLPVIPFLVLPLAWWLADAAHQSRRRFVVALTVFSAAVQIPGVLVDFTKVGYTPDVRHLTWHDRTWTWPGSEIALNLKSSASALPLNARNLATNQRPALRAPTGEARDFSEQFAFSLDFWWVYLFYLGAVSAPVAMLLGTAGLTAAAFAGAKAIRSATT